MADATPHRPEPTADASRSARRAWWHRPVRGLVYGFFALAVVLILLVLVLQTEIGRSRVQSIAVGQIENLFVEEAEVEVARLDGNFLTGARLTGLVVRLDGEPVVTVDTVLVDYDLLTLVRRRFSASAVYVGGPTVYARQRADSTFALAHLLAPAAEDDTTASDFIVQVDSLGLRRGRAEIRYYNTERDSVVTVEDLTLKAHGLYSGPDSLTVALDLLRAEALAPGDSARLTLVADAGRFSGDALDLPRVHLASAAGTDVTGSLRLGLGERAAGLPRLTADLAVQPLQLSDVRAFTGADLYGAPRLRVSARPVGDDQLSFSAQGALHDGGTLSLDGTLDGGGRSLRYRVEGQMRGVNPAVLTRNDALAATLNADLRVDLSGRSARTLDGPFALTVTDSRVGDRAIERLRLDGSFRTGRLDFDLDADVPGARLTAEGNARPFDPTPTYEVRGEAGDVDLATLLRDPSQTTRFRGIFQASGVGFAPETAVADATVALEDLRTGDLALDYFDATAELRAGLVTFVAETQVAGGGGLVTAAGDARPFAEPLTYRITQGQLQNLDLARLTGNPEQSSDLTGTFTLDGRGVAPQALSLDFAAALRDSRYGDPASGRSFDLVAVDVDGTLQGGTLAFDAAADLGRAGYLQAEGTAQPFGEVIRYQAQGRVENLDLAELTGDPARASDLTADFTAEGRGTDPATLSLDARFAVSPSSYGAQEVTGGDLRLRLSNGDLALTGDLQTGEGEITLDVTGRPFDENPSFAVGGQTCFRSLDLATLTGNPAYRSRLSGCFQGDLAGVDPATASGGGTLTLGPSTVNDAEFEGGTVTFALRDGRLDAEADLRLADQDGDGAPDGRLSLDAEGRFFDARPTYALSGTADRLDAAALLGLSEPEQRALLSLTFDLEGEGTDPETMRLDARLAGGNSRLGTARIDTLRAALALDGGVLDVDTLLVESNLLDATGDGRLVLSDDSAAGPSDFTFRADFKDLSTLNAYTPEPLALSDGYLEARITGTAGAPLMLDVSAVAEQLAYGATAVNGLDSRLTGTFDPASGAAALRTRVEFDFFAQPGLLIERGDLDLVWNGEEVTVEGEVAVDRRRDVAFFARLDFNPDAPAVVLERFGFTVDGQAWSIAAPTRITYGDAYRVQNLLLRAADGTQQIAADGVIDPGGEQAFVLTIEDLETDGLTDLFGYDGLGGRLTTTLLMTGPAENPEIAGTLALSDFTTQSRPVGSIDVAVDYADARLGLDARLDHISGRTLTAEGYLPVRFSLAAATDTSRTAFTEGEIADEVRFEVRADSFPVAWVEPFLDPRSYTEVGGTLTADVLVSGTQGDPQLDGEALLADGRLGLAAVGRVYETITVPIRFLANQARIEQATIRNPESGAVHLEAEGTVTLPRLSVGELDLTVRPRRFLAMETPTYDGLVLDAAPEPIHLTGTIENPVLRGSVVLAEGDIYLTDELVAPDIEQVTLSDEDLRLIEARFGRRITARDTAVSRFIQALDLDLTVQIERDVWLRARSGLPFDIEFRGDVRALKAPYAPQNNLYGTIDLTRGSVETLGRRFDIQSGQLVFNGPVEETLVDIEATLDVRTSSSVSTSGVEITLLARGRLGDDLTVTLTSTPQLDNADIVSLIATGQLAEDFFGGGAAIGSLGGGLVLGQLTTLVEGVAGNALGLDVIQIDQEPGGLKIRLGKYLTNKAFVSLGQPLVASDARGQAGTEVTLEYALLRWLLLQLEYEDLDVQSRIGAGGLIEISY